MPRGSNFKRPYPPEFRREAIELYRRSGRPLVEVAGDLGIATESLRSWVKQAGIDAGLRNGLTSAEREELRRLRRENRILRDASGTRRAERSDRQSLSFSALSVRYRSRPEDGEHLTMETRGPPPASVTRLSVQAGRGRSSDHGGDHLERERLSPRLGGRRWR